jgi:hypothetical protein
VCRGTAFELMAVHRSRLFRYVAGLRPIVSTTTAARVRCSSAAAAGRMITPTPGDGAPSEHCAGQMTSIGLDWALPQLPVDALSAQPAIAYSRGCVGGWGCCAHEAGGQCSPALACLWKLPHALLIAAGADRGSCHVTGPTVNDHCPHTFCAVLKRTLQRCFANCIACGHAERPEQLARTA